jgi:hypothetical protein
MGSKKIVLVVTTLAAVLLGSAGTAMATGPNCSVGYPKKGYDVGKKIGANITQQAWNGVGQDPLAFDDFLEIVLDQVNAAIANLPTNASDYVKCRAKGLLQGVTDELGRIQDDVEDQCLVDGTAWGLVMADFYCALSNALGGLGVAGLLPNPPNGLCGDSFEPACHASFDAFAHTPANVCLDFTKVPFKAVFAEAKANACIF